LKKAIKTPNPDLRRMSVADYKISEKLPVVVILDNVRSMHNVGAAFRTSDAFCIEKIFLCGITATPPHREIHKTALGATDTVAWLYEKETTELVSSLINDGYIIIAIEQVQPHKPLQEFSPDPGSKYAFVFGNEVHGVTEEVVEKCDFCIEIPQSGTKHSLNISVSLGIVLWEVYRKLTLKT